MSFLGFGGSGLKVQIVLEPQPKLSHAPADASSSSSSSASLATIVQLDHAPSWKVRKSPFTVLRYPPRNGPLPIAKVGASDVSGGTYADFGQREQAPIKNYFYAYDAREDVEGQVVLTLPPGKKADHLGIQVQFLGRIDMSSSDNSGRPHYDFISLSRELAPPGTVYPLRSVLPFAFRNVEKDYETYNGRNVSVRYFIRVQMERKFFPPITQDQEVIIQKLGAPPAHNPPIKMEVGIEDCLHIEFEYERRCYHLEDVVVGKINFLLVRIKIKHMELALIRRETTGEGIAATAAAASAAVAAAQPGMAPQAAALAQQQQQQQQAAAAAANVSTETQTLAKYEIMDGAPVRGEEIPVRLYLKGIPADLTPTYDAINNRFSVRYFLNLVLVDEEDRRYFKQQEIMLWRKEIG